LFELVESGEVLADLHLPTKANSHSDQNSVKQNGVVMKMSAPNLFWPFDSDSVSSWLSPVPR
jgi:hypothetical protein